MVVEKVVKYILGMFSAILLSTRTQPQELPPPAHKKPWKPCHISSPGTYGSKPAANQNVLFSFEHIRPLKPLTHKDLKPL